MDNPLQHFSFTDPFSTWWPFIVAAIVGIITTLRSFIMGPECPSKRKMTGKTIVITGGSSGVGLEVVIELLNRDALVIMGTRNIDQTEETLRTLIKKKRIRQNSQWILKMLDLSSLESVRQFASSIDTSKVDILINNAGVSLQEFSKTKDGFESHLGVNFLAHFLLSILLLPKLKLSSGGRIINTTAHIQSHIKMDVDTLTKNENYSPTTAFAKSKLALIIMTRSLSSSWHGNKVTINAVNLGLVRGTKHSNKTLVSRSFYFRLMVAPSTWLFMKTPQQAAQTIIYLAVAEEVEGISGRYFSNCSEIKPSENAMDFEQGRNLIQKAIHLTQLHGKEAKPY